MAVKAQAAQCQHAHLLFGHGDNRLGGPLESLIFHARRHSAAHRRRVLQIQNVESLPVHLFQMLQKDKSCFFFLRCKVVSAADADGRRKHASIDGLPQALCRILKALQASH